MRDRPGTRSAVSASKMNGPVQSGWRRGDPVEELVTREWLVTNGLGGYASGTIGGVCTRRFHGKLIAAMPAPLGRTLMVNHLEEHLVSPDGRTWLLSGDERKDGPVHFPTDGFLEEFVLECGIPVWRFAGDGIRLEKRVVMPYGQNTTWMVYRLLEGPENLVLRMRPSLHFRPHEGLLAQPSEGWTVKGDGTDIEIEERSTFPCLRIALLGRGAGLEADPLEVEQVLFRIERSRGYDHEGPMWSPGVVHLELDRGTSVAVVASVEPWDVIHALGIDDVLAADGARRNRLLSMAGEASEENTSAQLVLAADQFLISPHTRSADTARLTAAGETPRTVIAGYHWFTDWGRDTMIS
ncbi:MAG: glycogen debranching enzyme N-terminal domain-containing protein, partial [Acidobacteriota bacterium]